MNYQGYDICIDDEGKKCIDIYNFEEIRVKEENKTYYRFTFLSREYIEDIASKIKELRSMGYYNINSFKANEDKTTITNPLAIALFILNMGRYKIIEKVYAPIILNDMCYLVSYAAYIDMNTGKEYVIKLHNYGVWNEELEQTLKEQNYIHVSDSNIKSINITNKSRALKLGFNVK